MPTTNLSCSRIPTQTCLVSKRSKQNLAAVMEGLIREKRGGRWVFSLLLLLVVALALLVIPPTEAHQSLQEEDGGRTGTIVDEKTWKILKNNSYYVFSVEETPYTRLCSTKRILTVNGKFPGPTLYVRRGEIVRVAVYNNANYNITIHWHGVKQFRNPWSDGPEYITQCPIPPGGRFLQTLVLNEEEGTVWWHAHSSWARNTVHGAIVVYPRPGSTYPFPKTHKEQVIVIGEWWRNSIFAVLEEMLRTGGAPNASDAYTINGLPGDLYNCSQQETFTMTVEKGKRYLLRLVQAGMNDETFFSIAGHKMTVVGSDGSYLKPFVTDYLMIGPGETMDVLIEANQSPKKQYYMAVRAYSSNPIVGFDNTTATAIIRYADSNNKVRRSTPLFPNSTLPGYFDTEAAYRFDTRLRSLNSKEHPALVPMDVDEHLLTALSINQIPCPAGVNATLYCQGPNSTRLAASTNNISFVAPQDVDILEAAYFGIPGVFSTGYPNEPPVYFNFTGPNLPQSLLVPNLATEVKVFDYGTVVQLVMQGTNLSSALNHPMHIHGYSFYVLAIGFGNYNETRDSAMFNLVDPPYKNTIGVPPNGWAVIRFKANNPGVWFWHCHLERHMTWGMNTAFIIKDGEGKHERMLPRPNDMPPCPGLHVG